MCFGGGPFREPSTLQVSPWGWGSRGTGSVSAPSVPTWSFSRSSCRSCSVSSQFFFSRNRFIRGWEFDVCVGGGQFRGFRTTVWDRKPERGSTNGVPALSFPTLWSRPCLPVHGRVCAGPPKPGVNVEGLLTSLSSLNDTVVRVPCFSQVLYITKCLSWNPFCPYGPP